VGVALVASAAKTLIRGTCKDRIAMVINALAAVAVLLYPATWMFPLVIVLGEQPCYKA
jgi:chromate transport protein ChrA